MVQVFTYHCDDESSLVEIEKAATSAPGVLFTNRGDKVIKVCSENEFSSTKGNLVLTESGSVYNVSIKGMTCFRCVNAISNVVKDLPVQAFSINLDKASGLFALGEGIDINMIGHSQDFELGGVSLRVKQMSDRGYELYPPGYGPGIKISKVNTY